MERARQTSGKKQCNLCGKVKPVSDFPVKRHWRNPEAPERYFRSRCKKCHLKKGLPYYKKSISRYPEKSKSRAITTKAIKDGLIKRLPCKVCGDKKVHIHHLDYNKPLDIVFLCRQHHEDIHHGRLNLTN